MTKAGAAGRAAPGSGRAMCHAAGEGARAPRALRGGEGLRGAQHPENPLNGVGLVAPQAV